MSSPFAWDLGLTDDAEAKAAKADAEIRISDFLLFALIPLVGIRVPEVGVPLNELVALAVLALAALRQPPPGVRVPLPVVAGLAALVGLIVVSGLLNDVPLLRRGGHLVIYAALVLALATGRVSLRSAALGLGVGLITVAALAYVGIGGRFYGERLTGFFRDPNVAALVLSALGCLAVGFVRWRANRVLVASLLIVALVLTYSRIGLLALAMILIWTLGGRRLGIKGGAALVAGMVWLIANLPDSLRLIGPFRDRDGSDALRDRILALEYARLDGAPWYGNGPGTSIVRVGADDFFFHNSYLSTRNEGGWPLLLVVLALIAYCFVTLSAGARAGDVPSIACQAALIALLAVSVTLGEVFLELPTAIVLGFALRTRHDLARRRSLARAATGTTPDG